jgi:hypothetical protein
MNSNLWVVDPRQVTFLCLSKEKSPKEKTPPSLRRSQLRRAVPCAPRSSRARAELAGGRKARPLGLKHRLATPRSLPSGARLALGGRTTNPRYLVLRWVCSWVPLWRGDEHRRVWGEARQGSGQEVRSQSTAQGRAVDWRGPQTREAQKPFAPSGACFLLGTFLCTSKEKYPDRGSGTANTTSYIDHRARSAQHKSRARGARYDQL